MLSNSQNTLSEPDRLSMDRLPKELRKSIVETLGSPIIPLLLDRRPTEPAPVYAPKRSEAKIKTKFL
jgi:hypothetical protein